MTSPKIATFHDAKGTKGTTATTAMWKLIHGGQQSRSHRHGGRQSAGVQLRTRRRFGMVSYNSNLPYKKKNIIQSLKVPLTILALTIEKKKCRPFGVHFNWLHSLSLSLSLKEDAPVTRLKANVFKRDYWKLEITILLHPGPTRHTLFRIAHDVCAFHT